MVSRICGQEGGEGVGTGHNLTPAQADVLHGVRCQYVFIVLECLTKSWLCDMALAVVSYVHPLSTIQIQNALIYIVCLSHNVKYLIEE